MDANDQLRLRLNYKLLVDTLTLDEIWDSLVTDGVVDMHILEKIHKEPSEKDKMRCLLRELRHGGPGAYSAFCRAVEENGCYQHVSDALSTTVLAQTSVDQATQDNSAYCPEEELLRIKANHKQLVDQVRYCDVRDHLYQDGALDDQGLEKMDLMKTSTERERMQNLLKLVYKEACRCSSFRRALSDYPCYGHIVQLLTDTDLEKARGKFLSKSGDCERGNADVRSGENSIRMGDGVDWKAVFTTISQDPQCLKRWKQLRVLPGIEESDIFSTEMAHKSDGPRECVYQLLHCWRQKRGHQANLEEIIQTLEQLGLRATASKIRKFHGSPPVS